MSESVRNVCRVTNDDHSWKEGLAGDVSCSRCHDCPNILDELLEKDRLAWIVDKLRGVPSVGTDQTSGSLGRGNAGVTTTAETVGISNTTPARGPEEAGTFPRTSEAPKCNVGTPGCGIKHDGSFGEYCYPRPTEARDPAECNGSGVYSGICSRGKRGCNTLHPEAPRTDYPRKEKQMLSNESVLEWAASWVPDEPPGQRARFVEGLRRELESRPETARHIPRPVDYAQLAEWLREAALDAVSFSETLACSLESAAMILDVASETGSNAKEGSNG